MSQVLLDASVMVALFDDDDVCHDSNVIKLESCHSQGLSLLTTWPCVTEASYLLSPHNHFGMLSWLTQGACDVAAFEVSDLSQMMAWMQTYSEPKKTQMDFADASLMWLAMQRQVRKILTEDTRDFFRYRLPDGQMFEIL